MLPIIVTQVAIHAMLFFPCSATALQEKLNKKCLPHIRWRKIIIRYWIFFGFLRRLLTARTERKTHGDLGNSRSVTKTKFS